MGINCSCVFLLCDLCPDHAKTQTVHHEENVRIGQLQNEETKGSDFTRKMKKWATLSDPLTVDLCMENPLPALLEFMAWCEKRREDSTPSETLPVLLII